MQIMSKGDRYHCQFCHHDFRYSGEVTGCGQQCCHGADEMLTPKEVWLEHKLPKPWETGKNLAEWNLSIKKKK